MNKIETIFNDIEKHYGSDIFKTFHIDSDRLELSRKIMDQI